MRLICESYKYNFLNECFVDLYVITFQLTEHSQIKIINAIS